MGNLNLIGSALHIFFYIRANTNLYLFTFLGGGGTTTTKTQHEKKNLSKFGVRVFCLPSAVKTRVT